jgi:hypothetical protein
MSDDDDGKSGHIEVEIKCRVTNLDLCTCYLLSTPYCFPSTACRILLPFYCLPTTAVYCPPSTASRLLPPVNCLQSTPPVNCLPSTASRQLPPVNCLPSTASRQLPAVYCLSSAACGLPDSAWHFDGSERQRAEEKCYVMGRTGRGHLTEKKSV